MDLSLTQEGLGRKFGVNRDWVRNWETNRMALNLRQIPQVLEFLGYNPLSQDGPLSQRLRNNRLELGLTQLEFGRLLGVGRETIVNWEGGKRTPADSFLERVREILGE